MKGYFFKIPYGKKAEHWVFERFKSKKALKDAHKGAREILSIEQLKEKYTEDEMRAIARNVLVYKPHVRAEFPQEIQDLIK